MTTHGNDKAKHNTVLGRWRITWMELWGQDFVDLDVPGYIKLQDDDHGEFQFGLVIGSFYANPGNDHFDSKWEGADEMEEAFGEIDGTLEEGELHGTVSFWSGDESDYRAVRLKQTGKS